MTKRVALAGCSGLIGGALRRHLQERGDEVLRLVRRPIAAADEIQWDPARGHLPADVFSDIDAVVNLAGVGIGDRRWTEEHKQEVLTSRVQATETIAAGIAAEHRRSGRKVRLVNASAVGAYGNRGDETLTEASPPGPDFLADVVLRWERATGAAAQAGAPVAMVRSGLVMAREGGAFAPLVLLARLGLGGPMGSGAQWWPWITLEDEVRGIAFLLDRPEITGPVNLVSPAPARQRDVAGMLGRVLHRPAFVPAPRIALRIVIGEFADEILASQRVLPARLSEEGFTFEHPDLEGAVRWLVSHRPARSA